MTTLRRPDTSDHAGDLRRSIDQAVRRAWLGRGLAAAGCWLAAAAAVVATLAAIDLASGGRLGISLLPVAAKVPLVLAVAAAPAAALLWRRISRDGWPSRLGIALATEAHVPRLGESLSRAVGFLDEQPFGSPPLPPAARGFRQLAVEQVASAAQEAGGFVVPGFAADVGWTAAGLAAVLLAWSSMTMLPKRWADAVRRQVAAPSADASASPAAAGGNSIADEPWPSEARLAGTRLAGAAATERRLAGLLATIFARAPGLTAASLSPAARRELEALAAVPTECQREIDAARRLLSAALSASALTAGHGDRIRRALSQLEPLEWEARTIAADIAANRLHRAGDAALAVADTLAAAAATLGAATDAPPAQAAFGPLAAAAAAAAALDRSLAAGTDSATVVAATGASPDGAATTGRDGPTEAGSLVVAGGSGSAAAAPAGVGGGAEPRRPSQLPADAAPIEQVWSLRPGGERPQTTPEAVELGPPAYRSAIDTYYRLLLQSSSSPESSPERPGRRSQPPR